MSKQLLSDIHNVERYGGTLVACVMEFFNLNHHRGAIMKYICRAEHKGQEYQDLRKAHWYLTREVLRQTLNTNPNDDKVVMYQQCIEDLLDEAKTVVS